MGTQSITKTKWNIDATHSEIGFRVKHMMITSVSGSFAKFDATVESDGSDFATALIDFNAQVDSISTGNADRDNHLKSADFFDAAHFPNVTFRSTKIVKENEGNFVAHGDLTVRGITRPVKLEVAFGGIGVDPWGNEKAGFTIAGKINRTDFGLKWNAALETGGVLVSEEVKLFGEVQLTKEK